MGIFPESATFDCTKKDIYNVTIRIRATLCNGIIECEYVNDESNCDGPLPSYISENQYIFLFALAIIGNSFLAIGMWKINKKKFRALNKALNTMKINGHILESLHKDDQMKTLLKHAQAQEDYESINQQFIFIEVSLHNGNIDEAVCCIKVELKNEHNKLHILII